MIRTKQALKLARTKLKIRPIRLSMLLITMSVMFAGLVFVANVSSGIIGSLKTFGKEGLGGRYLVEARPVTYNGYDNGKLTSRFEPQQKQLIADKKALAKTLGIAYDPANDTSLYYTDQQNGPSRDDVIHILTNSPLGLAALEVQNRSIPGTSYDEFVAQAKRAGAVHYYRSSDWAGMTSQGVGGIAGTVSVLVGGKEDYNDSYGKEIYAPTGVASIQTLGWKQMSGDLLQPFLFPGQTTKVGKDGAIPVVAPYSAAEQMLGLPELPTTATSAQKLERLLEVRRQTAGKTAQLCYRNYASQALLQQAIQQRTEIANNKGKVGYTLPHVQYDLPTTACGATTTKSDTRTAAEKKEDANQKTFDDTFNPRSEAEQGVATLRIVGVSPDMDGGRNRGGLSGILSSVLQSTIGYGWFSPSDAFVPGSIATQAQGGTLAEQPLARQQYYAEFPTLAAATDFMKKANCDRGEQGTNVMQIYDPNAGMEACISQRKMLSVHPYGNNAAAISSFQDGVWKGLRYVLLVMIIIATIVMVGTFGKVIADSRRETAVFRALGATRLDISQIYLTYTFLVGLLVSAVALVLGSVGAQLLNNHVSADLSVNAVVAYNARDPHMQFSIAGFNIWYLGAIVGLIVLVALLSAIIPLFTNMRRNPIRDMRDE